MNTQILRFPRSLGVRALVFAGVVFLTVALAGSRSLQASNTDDCHCYEWQYCDENGDCTDKPHVHHHYHVHYEPEGGEQCWIECMCQEGTYPSGNDCGACSFVGTVCMDL